MIVDIPASENLVVKLTGPTNWQNCRRQVPFQLSKLSVTGVAAEYLFF